MPTSDSKHLQNSSFTYLNFIWISLEKSRLVDLGGAGDQRANFSHAQVSTKFPAAVDELPLLQGAKDAALRKKIQKWAG